jgi:hypothetical protein
VKSTRFASKVVPYTRMLYENYLKNKTVSRKNSNGLALNQKNGFLQIKRARLALNLVNMLNLERTLWLS